MEGRPEDQGFSIGDDEEETFEGVGVPAKQRTVLEPPDDEEIELEPADRQSGDSTSQAGS